MNRSVCPRSRKYSQRAGISPSLTPRWMTQLILIGNPSAGRPRRFPARRAGDAEAEAVHLAGRVLVERIDRHIEPVEAGRAQIRRRLLQEPAVGRERDIGHAEIRLQDADKGGHIRPQQGLAPGQANFLYAEREEGPGDPRQLGQRHQLRISEKRVAGAERPPSACSTCSGNCSGLSPKCADRAAVAVLSWSRAGVE